MNQSLSDPQSLLSYGEFKIHSRQEQVKTKRWNLPTSTSLCVIDAFFPSHSEPPILSSWVNLTSSIVDEGYAQNFFHCWRSHRTRLNTTQQNHVHELNAKLALDQTAIKLQRPQHAIVVFSLEREGATTKQKTFDEQVRLIRYKNHCLQSSWKS